MIQTGVGVTAGSRGAPCRAVELVRLRLPIDLPIVRGWRIPSAHCKAASNCSSCWNSKLCLNRGQQSAHCGRSLLRCSSVSPLS